MTDLPKGYAPLEEEAPLIWKLGDRVRVESLCDDIGDPRYIGHTGTVTDIVTKGEDVGESSDHPMIKVAFDVSVRLRERVALVTNGKVETLPGYSVHDADGFWPEELQPWV